MKTWPAMRPPRSAARQRRENTEIGPKSDARPLRRGVVLSCGSAVRSILSAAAGRAFSARLAARAGVTLYCRPIEISRDWLRHATIFRPEGSGRDPSHHGV